MLKVYDIKQGIARLLGSSCLICKQKVVDSGSLCPYCRALLGHRHSTIGYCLRCAIELNLPSPDSNNAAIHCGECVTRPPDYDRCIAAVSYSPVAAHLVNNLKHHAQLAAADAMARLMVSTITGRYRHLAKQVDSIIPVPLSGIRLRQRGFNQAIEIAKPIGNQLNIPVMTGACRKIIDTPSQQSLGLEQRAKNLANAFTVVQADAVRDRNIAIIDDVVTTTATANTLAKVILQAGASTCDIWCFARTPAPAQSSQPSRN